MEEGHRICVQLACPCLNSRVWEGLEDIHTCDERDERDRCHVYTSSFVVVVFSFSLEMPPNVFCYFSCRASVLVGAGAGALSPAFSMEHDIAVVWVIVSILI